MVQVCSESYSNEKRVSILTSDKSGDYQPEMTKFIRVLISNSTSGIRDTSRKEKRQMTLEHPFQLFDWSSRCGVLWDSITLTFNTYGCRWSADVYDLLHARQEAKGFNPVTTAFAHSLGLSEMEIIYPNTDEHFQAIPDDSGAPIPVFKLHFCFSS